MKQRITDEMISELEQGKTVVFTHEQFVTLMEHVPERVPLAAMRTGKGTYEVVSMRRTGIEHPDEWFSRPTAAVWTGETRVPQPQSVERTYAPSDSPTED